MKNIFILIPSLSSTGPIKGAIALANALSKYRSVTIVSVKKGNGSHAFIENNVKYICLSEKSTILSRKIQSLINILKDAGGKKYTATISFCFSADFINLFCSKYTHTCSSVRGNLINIYKLDYGIIGIPAALFHFFMLIKFNNVVAMSNAMAEQIFYFTQKYPQTIGNFIDEKSLKIYKKSFKNVLPTVIRFVFVGSLSVRKKPLLLLHSLKELHNHGFKVSLDIIGDGPLYSKLKFEINRLELQDFVNMHGYLSNPFEVIAGCDIFVLPSLSEGTARACLEALYIGLPCILREIDGNSELIQNNFNGILFKNDHNLTNAMKKSLNLIKYDSNPNDLLPLFFRQNESALKYLSLIEMNHNY